MKYFLYALCLTLIILKLTNFIDWSWWYVLMPLYGGIVIFAPLLIWLAVLKAKQERKINELRKSRPSRFQEKLDAYMDQQRNK